MSSVVNVAIHASQFPEKARRDLIESLRSRKVNHKFHYDSVKQTQKWLALHEAHSPARTDPDCAATYERGFLAAAAAARRRERERGNRVHVIGLGCGGGQKDARLLELLSAEGTRCFYTPSDVSTAMVLTAYQAASEVIPGEDCFPLVCDLATADDLPEVLNQRMAPEAARLITFFGMIPNFEPQEILPRLSNLLRPGDSLLFSANLAPGPDYSAGMQRILPLYDNALTQDWLLTFLFDLGVEGADGELRFRVEDDPAGSGLKRVAACFHFLQSRQIRLGADGFEFKPGEAIRLFFSYRHTPGLARALLEGQGLEVAGQWITKSEEEGVFLCGRGPG
jgi:uncharacterized SAM-dependent methyltransferase